MSQNLPSITLLAIDDDSVSLELIKAILVRDGLDVVTTTDPVAGLELVRDKRPSIVLIDLMMPRLNGMELLERIVDIDPGIDVVLLTGHYSTQSAVEAIQKGACDYITKPFGPQALRERIDHLLTDARRRQRTLSLEDELRNWHEFEGMVGRSPVLEEVFARIRRVAPHYRNLLITGPSGTGKELAARALHRLSPVTSGKFAACNCSALVETLIESELFGHVAGAFTGAVRDRVGLFEYAHGGTVFLDEIAELPLTTQAKILRVLQNQEIQRVGSATVRRVDVRIIAATHSDLRAMVAQKQFRDDLYYRLSVVEIKLPRLADRKEDLPLLQRHFLERFAKQYNKPLRGLTRRTQTLLARHSWPGNIRELENVLANACMMAEGENIDVRDLPEYLQAPLGSRVEEDDPLISLDEVQRRHALKVLELMDGNKLRAAQVLGISRATFYRLLNEDGIKKRTEALQQ